MGFFGDGCLSSIDLNIIPAERRREPRRFGSKDTLRVPIRDRSVLYREGGGGR
jgi:hypothetical protein